MAEQLGSAVLTVSVDDTQLQAGLQAARRQADSTGKAMSQGLGGSANTIGRITSKLDGLQRELQDVEIGSRRFRELRREIEQTEKRLNGLQGRGGGLSNLLSGLAGLGAGAAAGAFLKQSIDAAVQLETITKKLSNTLGPQGAAGALAFTQGLSDQLGLSFKTLAGSFASFTAAATAANVPLQVQKDLFSAVSKAAQQLGLSNDEINGSLLALQQIASKGTVSMEELRGQLGERLPIAFAAAAKGLGVTQRELIKLVETGGLTAREFFPAITKGLNELTAASAGAPTAAQNFQKLGNAWDALQTSFGTDLLPSVIESVRIATAVIEGLGRKQRADRLGFNTGPAGIFGQLSGQAVDAVENLKRVQEQYSLTEKQADALFTNAVATTRQGRFVQSPAFLNADSISRVNKKVRELAQSYRNANPDRTGDAKRAEAEAARLLEIDKARADAQKQFIEGPRQALRDAQALQGLQGAALQLAQQQLNIDKLRAAERQAIAEYDKKLSAAGFDRENTGVIQAAAKVEGASLAVRTALVEGSSALQQASRDAARELLAAQQSIANAQQLSATPTFSTGEPGPARAAVQQVQGILQSVEQARQALIDAATQSVRAFANGLSGDALEALVTQTKAAGEQFKLALISGADTLRQASLQAAEALKQAQLDLANVLSDPTGLNKFLSPQLGQERNQQALQSILPLFRAAQGTFQQITGAAAPDFAGGIQDVLAAVQDFIRRVDTEVRARENVQLAGRSLEAINAGLADVTSQLATATQNLADKDWNVYVNVPGGSASGDGVAAVNGGF